MPTRGIGYAFRQRPAQARFCPWCGVESLERDQYKRDRHSHGVGNGGCHPEFTCRTCGSGFELRNSNRADQAVALLRAESRLRPDDFEKVAEAEWS